MPSSRKPLVPFSAPRFTLAAKVEPPHAPLAASAAARRPRCPVDAIVVAVAFHVPRRGNRAATVVVGIDAVEPETVGSIERGEVHAGSKARLSEHHVTLAGKAVRVGR